MPVCIGITAALILVFMFALLIKRGTSSSRRGVTDPNSWGTPARGILLGVDVFSQRTWRSGVRVEVRNMLIDVEIPGFAPYEVNVRAAFPTNIVRDLIPGAAVELRVNPRNRSDVYILGLAAGFSAAGMLQAANPGAAPALSAPRR